jgi:5-methyltetrahydropteroyltriglutamate--homocysteine methyltransferase
MKAKTKKAPFRFDIVGKFLRHQRLKEARAKFEKNEITADKLKKVEDEEIRKLLETQKKVGLQTVKDGDFHRSWWHLDFMWGLTGIEKRAAREGYKFKGKVTRAETARQKEVEKSA